MRRRSDKRLVQVAVFSSVLAALLGGCALYSMWHFNSFISNAQAAIDRTRIMQ